MVFHLRNFSFLQHNLNINYTNALGGWISVGDVTLLKVFVIKKFTISEVKTIKINRKLKVFESERDTMND